MPKAARIDPSVGRTDLVRQAAADSESFPSAFDWINDREEERVANDQRNRGLDPKAIRDEAREFILKGGAIKCVPELGGQYKDRRHFHYDIIIPMADFPKGLYVEMELDCPDPDKSPPSVNLLNAHPSGD